MDGRQKLVPKTPNNSARSISERLINERAKAFEILKSKSEKNVKRNALQTEKEKEKLANFTKSTINSKPTTSKVCSMMVKNLKKSPVNKENISTQSRLQTTNASNKLPVPKTSPKITQKLDNVLKNKSPAKHVEETNLPTQRNANKTRVYQKAFNDSENNNTDYVPQRYLGINNVSELMTSSSITLEDTSDVLTPRQNVSFDPAEITGRSTLYKRDLKTQQTNLLSVDEILATSFAPKARDLRHSLIGTGDRSDRSTSMASSCISDFSIMQKNPRPTNMSSFFSEKMHFEGENMLEVNESFTPGELMTSALLNDEILWAQEKAAAPTVMLSEEAKRKLASKNASINDVSSCSTQNAFGCNDMSMGHYFGLKNVNDLSIFKCKSPPLRTPCALVSDDTITTTTSTITSSNSPNFQSQTRSLNFLKEPANTETHESKDSGNITGKSDNCNLSALEKALEHLDLINNSHGSLSINRFLQHGPDSRASQRSADSIMGLETAMINTAMAAQTGDAIDLVRQTEKLNSVAEILLENKENIELFNKNSKHSDDTQSLTDSLLNTSIQNYRRSSAGQARSPLSPIPILVFDQNEGDDADIEEVANTCETSLDRRKRYSKSPTKCANATDKVTDVLIILNDEDDNDKNNDYAQENESIYIEKTPVNKVSVARIGPSATVSKRTKSLCSTRLENNRYSTNSAAVDSSPNFGKQNKTLTPTNFYASNNGTVSSFDISPLSSPKNYTFSTAGSPFEISDNASRKRNDTKDSQCSPNFDRTTNSEQRFLSPTTNTTNGALRKVVSSPTTSESSSTIRDNYAGYGVPPMRTHSSNSIKSVESASSRSTSRCSHTSEFSHRDGKPLPLKVTKLELSWGSVKLRTYSQKSMQIKNTSNKRLVIRLGIYGPGFQLINPESNMLTLQSQECRTIIINFCPTMTGPALGKLMFQPPKSSLNNGGHNGTTATTTSSSLQSNVCSSDVVIPLYAYGGHAAITIQNLLKGPLGPPYLPMGEFCALIRPLERTFRIYNKGPLKGFATVWIEPTGVEVPELCNAFDIHPDCLLIEPDTVASINIVFQPNRDALKKMKNFIHDVLTLAKLRIVYGDEPMRQRLRQIRQQMTTEARNKILPKSLDKLWTSFPGERAEIQCNFFKENSCVGLDIWSCISQQEVVLTLNNNMLDETAAELSTIFADADNTILFRTVCVTSPTQQLDTVDELLEESHAAAFTTRLVATRKNYNEVSSTSKHIQE